VSRTLWTSSSVHGGSSSSPWLIHRRTTNGDTPEAEAAGRIDPTSSASLTPRTLAGTQVEQAQAVAILMPGCNGET
jgi:hypothetical protein